MSLNYSDSLNATHGDPSLSTSSTIHDLMFQCLNSGVGSLSITAFAAMCFLLLLPLCAYVLHLGRHRLQQQRPSTATSHSDVFTYNMAAIELMNVMGSVLCCCGVHARVSVLVMIGVYLFSVTFSAQLLFHVLTCVERHLAVVHPVVYLGLRNSNAVAMRNLVVVFSWLLSFTGTAVMSLASHTVITIVSFCIVSFAVVVIAFCSLSLLWVLVRSGPGEGGGEKHRVDQVKLRAFHTIMAIFGVLLLRFVGNIYTNIMYDSQQLDEAQRCASSSCGCLSSGSVCPAAWFYRCSSCTEQKSYHVVNTLYRQTNVRTTCFYVAT